MNKRTIKQHIRLCGVFGRYEVHTAEFAGLDSTIPLTNAAAGFAIVRALRDLAANKPTPTNAKGK
jgi:hypothetical protein